MNDLPQGGYIFFSNLKVPVQTEGASQVKGIVL